MKTKRGVMEFAWIFAIIVGAVILFLAFYFVGNKLLSQKYEQATIEAQNLDMLLNPFSQFGELKALDTQPIALSRKSTLEFSCQEPRQKLGNNDITINVGGQQGISRIVYDKYIFSEKTYETKSLQGLSVPFEMPWRVANLIMIWPQDRKYCFIGAPQFIKDELSGESPTGLNISSIAFSQSSDQCPENTNKTVCFSGNCDIKVTLQNGGSSDRGSTRKSGQTVYFTGNALMYASIFSDSDIYNCNVKRLMARLYSETLVYEEKSRAMTSRGCNMNINLVQLKQLANTMSTSTLTETNINNLMLYAQQIKQQNQGSNCELF